MATNSKVRICHFTTVHVRTDVRILLKQCVTLAKAGYDVHLVVADSKGDDLFQGVKIHDIGRTSNRLTRMVFGTFRMFFSLVRLRCKVYHFHDPELLPLAYLLKIITRAKVIYDVHENYYDAFTHKDYLPARLRLPLALFIRRLELFVGKHIDQVIFATPGIAQSLSAINPHTEIIFNYPKVSEWTHLASTQSIPKTRSICYIGNITEERGITQLITALEKVDCLLHLAGTYEPLAYRHQLSKLPGWQKVCEYGYVNRREAADIISEAQAGVLLLLPKPNHYTALSTKVFEYMAGGIAVLTPDFPIWQDIVQGGDCGICVNPLDSEAIAASLNTILDNPDRTAIWGANGKQLVQEKYNWESQEQTLLAVYARLTAQS